MVEVAHLLLWCARENIEEVADNLEFLGVLWVSLEVGLLELVMGQAMEVVDVPFRTIV